MNSRVSRWLVWLERFTDRGWYLPLVSFLAGVDLFVLFIPTEGLLVTTAMLKPKRWILIFLAFTTGSALGALAMGAIVQYFGQVWIESWIASTVSAESWARTTELVDRHGALAIGLMALGPFPLAPAVTVAAIAKMKLSVLFVSSWVGRGIKYCFFAWAATHMPQALGRFLGATREIEKVSHAREESEKTR